MADRQQLPLTGQQHLLVCHEAGRRTEWMATSPPIDSAVALAVPDGASTFASLCASTISARGRCLAASAAKRIISTAPRAKFGA